MEYIFIVQHFQANLLSIFFIRVPESADIGLAL